MKVDSDSTLLLLAVAFKCSRTCQCIPLNIQAGHYTAGSSSMARPKKNTVLRRRVGRQGGRPPSVEAPGTQDVADEMSVDESNVIDHSRGMFNNSK